ncbi:hypothetical protein BKA93DRAFT_880604 [Sparassis latifolia]
MYNNQREHTKSTTENSAGNLRDGHQLAHLQHSPTSAAHASRGFSEPNTKAIYGRLRFIKIFQYTCSHFFFFAATPFGPLTTSSSSSGPPTSYKSAVTRCAFIRALHSM